LTLAALAGIALGTWLILYFGLQQVGDAFLSAGWQGLMAISVAYFVSLVLCAVAWRALLIKAPNGIVSWLWARWLRDSTGNLLAVVPAAGEVLAARELSLHGVPLGIAGASAVVDLTMEMASQLLFTFLGVAILLAERPGEASHWSVGVGLAVCAGAIGGFIVAQRKGLFQFLESLPDRLGWTQAWSSRPESEKIHAAIQDIYARPRRLLAGFSLHFAGWIAGVGEAWLGLWFMGHPLGLADVLVIESLVFALRTAAFAVPWAAGVQEGGYVVAGSLFGLAPEVALGLSLLKRAREIATGVPSLIVWQYLESRRLWGNRGRSRPTS
jgi:putative membrane protein